MTAHERRWPLKQAEHLALVLQEMLDNWCQRIEVAGSIRRKKADVGDIELVCIPRTRADLFGGAAKETLLDVRLQHLIKHGVLDYRLDARGHRSYGPLNKYLVHISSGIPVDVFVTTADSWGMAMVVRTGPADFNKRVMGTFKANGMKAHAYGGVEVEGVEVPCPTEEEVFRLLGWSYIPPEKRALWR